jgi:hypothetical protein
LFSPASRYFFFCGLLGSGRDRSLRLRWCLMVQLLVYIVTGQLRRPLQHDDSTRQLVRIPSRLVHVYVERSTGSNERSKRVRLATVQRPRGFLGEAGQARTSPSPCMCLPPPRVFFRNDRFTAAGRRGIFDDLVPNVSPLMTAQLPHMSCSRQTSKHEPDNYFLGTRHETDADPVPTPPPAPPRYDKTCCVALCFSLEVWWVWRNNRFSSGSK